MVEHGSVGFLQPGNNITEITQHLRFKFVERKFSQLRIEILEEDRQLI